MSLFFFVDLKHLTVSTVQGGVSCAKVSPENYICARTYFRESVSEALKSILGINYFTDVL